MFWHRNPKYSLDDIETILDMAFDRAQGMYLSLIHISEPTRPY